MLGSVCSSRHICFPSRLAYLPACVPARLAACTHACATSGASVCLPTALQQSRYKQASELYRRLRDLE